VSISQRLFNLVRANLTSLLDRIPGGEEPFQRRNPLQDLSDEEIEAELQRRKERRGESSDRRERVTWEEIGQAAREQRARYRTSQQEQSKKQASTDDRNARPKAAPTAGQDPRLAKLYAQLECPYGADLNTVRKHYRSLMLKYHPDKHSGSPERQRVATELTQRLTQSYNELRRVLEKT
jgi:DnaJ-domain-containing protein 1